MRAWMIGLAIGCAGKPAPQKPAEPPAKVSEPVREPPAKPVDEATLVAASSHFLDLLRAAKPAIARCYDAAVAKDASLTARTTTLNVVANFTAAGALDKVTFDPKVSEEFEVCVRATSVGWTMTPPTTTTFKVRINLAQ